MSNSLRYLPLVLCFAIGACAETPPDSGQLLVMAVYNHELVSESGPVQPLTDYEYGSTISWTAQCYISTPFYQNVDVTPLDLFGVDANGTGGRLGEAFWAMHQDQSPIIENFQQLAANQFASPQSAARGGDLFYTKAIWAYNPFLVEADGATPSGQNYSALIPGSRQAFRSLSYLFVAAHEIGHMLNLRDRPRSSDQREWYTWLMYPDDKFSGARLSGYDQGPPPGNPLTVGSECDIA